MDKKEPRGLQHPETWDFDKAEKRPAVKTPRVVVSVAFSRVDFDLVAESAATMGMRTSEFIRHAALERAGNQRQFSVQFSGGGWGASFFVSTQPLVTVASGREAGEMEAANEAAVN